MEEFINVFINIIVPLISGLVFFALAKYVKHIGPLRHFTAGKETYDHAFWGFITFGIYLASRPLQILLGPHPIPLIVNNIREFFMIGIFAPSIFIAIYGLAYGGENIKKWMRWVIYGICILLAMVFVFINIRAIGGAEEIFRIANYPAYDGMWFKNMTPERAKLMAVLFVCRVTSPVLVLAIGATIALSRAFHYPEERKKLYSNMPKKLILTGIGTYLFSISMLTVGFVWLLGKIPNQWWGYYVGALLAGFFESWSISLPVRKEEI